MARRNKASARRRRRRVLFGLELFVLLLLVGGLLIYAKLNNSLDKMDLDESGEKNAHVEVNEQVVGSKALKGYTNIALFGVDTREEDLEHSNSDTTIIASINNDTKEVKLVSVYRDTYLNVGKDEYDKCSVCNRWSGPVYVYDQYESGSGYYPVCGSRF